MPAAVFSLKSNHAAVELALKRGVKEAELANNYALKKTGIKAVSLTVKRTAAALSITQKPIRKKVKYFTVGKLNDRVLRVWAGVKKSIYLGDLSGRAQKRLESGSFEATMESGHIGQFVRRLPGKRWTKGRPTTSSPNLPIEAPQIRLSPTIDPILKASSYEAGRTVYPKELKRDYERRLAKISKSKIKR